MLFTSSLSSSSSSNTFKAMLCSCVKRKCFFFQALMHNNQVTALAECNTISSNAHCYSVRWCHSLPSVSERDEAIIHLSNDVFSRGNVLLKNVDMLSALPEGFHSFPEVCFIGKPNVGKSAIIGSLLHNPTLGKSQSKRGSTRLLKFFNVGDALLLVDTPGYGQWSERGVKLRFATQVNAFAILFRYLALRKNANLKRVYWVMEASAFTPMSFQPRDEELLGFLMNECIPFSVILNKIDRHYRHAVNVHKASKMVNWQGTPMFSWNPSLQALQSENERKVQHVYNPERGIARNMMEIYSFIGSNHVPILGVCTNARVPHFNLNIEALQHDIMYYCTQELKETADLTYKQLHDLSYAPPRMEQINEIQHRYPLESFIIPENDNTTLQEMVKHYESLCKRLMPHALTKHMSHNALLEGTIHENNNNNNLVHLSQMTNKTGKLLEENVNAIASHEAQLQLPYKSSVVHNKSINMTSNINKSKVFARFKPAPLRETEDATMIFDIMDAEDNDADDVNNSEDYDERELINTSTIKYVEDNNHNNCHDQVNYINDIRSSTPVYGQNNKFSVTCNKSDLELSDHNNVTCQSSCEQRNSCTLAPDHLEQEIQTAPTLSSSPSEPLPLPFALGTNSLYVRAIDGTPIPRAMLPSSVKDMVLSKEDELPYFATKSGAGVYERFIQEDNPNTMLAAHSPSAFSNLLNNLSVPGKTNATDVFLQSIPEASLPEHILDELPTTSQLSRLQQSKKRLIDKYLKKIRKERSIHMQAEGYMCPWLAAAGQPNRIAVQGLESTLSQNEQARLGQGGAPLHKLKSVGFGGMSLTRCTLKNRGRATKKTFWWSR